MIKWLWGDLLAQSFRNEPQAGFIETSPDAGKDFRRQTFTDINDLVQGSVTLTKDQYIRFINWYSSTTKQGANPFSFYDCRVEEYRTARFVGKPIYSENSTFFNATFQLSLDPIVKYVDYYLTTEDGKYLLTEDSKRIVATQELVL